MCQVWSTSQAYWWVEHYDVSRDRIQISAHSAAVDRKQKHEAHFCRFQREGRHQTLELTLQQVLLPCPFRRCRQNFSSCTFHELGAASSFVTWSLLQNLEGSCVCVTLVICTTRLCYCHRKKTTFWHSGRTLLS